MTIILYKLKLCKFNSILLNVNCVMCQRAGYIGPPPVQKQTLQLSIFMHLVNILKLSQVQKLIHRIFRISNILRTKKAHDLYYGNKVYVI